ncbi:hypothetical protein GRI97_03000 [Altererythrobacter xixiisoli]|uniref:Uncharacterized protein n=1 Tax=Croceibacterium xixiisoli TaxID=1476466 RepID=A0A6I4TQ30_9SPHN|nr:hypothetical protein [Croceibacterium xixiisoli]MXO97956.1 hypothetical protein [Croceibacterium xixiisoli]
MIAFGPLAAMAALIPAMTGPLPADARSWLVLPLCSGGSVSMPIDRTAPPADGSGPCCAKGCHAGDQRKKRFDRKQ